MTITDCARLANRQNGGAFTITPEMVQLDMSTGNFGNADGTINLLNYCAWLAKSSKRKQHGSEN